MTALLVVALAVPLLGAIAVVVVGVRHVAIGRTAAGTSAVAWAVLAATVGPDDDRIRLPALALAGTTGEVALGRLVPTVLASAAVAGLALLVAAGRHRSPWATSAALTGITLLATAAVVGDDGAPDRPLGVGILALVALAAVRLRADRAPLPAALVVLLGGTTAAVGVALDDAATAGALAALGAALVAAGCALGTRPAAGGTRPAADGPGWLLVPPTLLALVRAADLPRDGTLDALGTTVDGVVVAGAVGVALAAVALVVARRAPVTSTAPAAAVAVAAGLLASGEPDLRRAGLLVAAGAVAAAVARHPLALVGLLPGALAAVDAAAAATGRDHAALAVACALAVAAGATGPVATERGRVGVATAVPGVVLATVPTWGWAGVALPDLTGGVAVAGAAGLAAVGAAAAAPQAATAWSARRARTPARGVATRVGGSLGRRPRGGSETTGDQVEPGPDPGGERDAPVEGVDHGAPEAEHPVARP